MMSEIHNVTPIRPNGAASDIEADAPSGAYPELENTQTGAIPTTVRALAETVITQNREAYEQARENMDGAVSMLEVTLERVGEGAIALNRKAIDITQDNLNSSFDLAKELAGAETLSGFMELQVAFARRQFAMFGEQAKAMHELSVQVADNAVAPMRAHLTHSISSLRTKR